ncbi:hypothetical protein OUZ56_015415 [Daphnia magna]|uniref:Uncharacterized protein n=1 Tax=Daphnia magna TaxID=35525 RepID=A0ABR0AMS7_9CRUS|nr:hypothetical protein OUZ56_015415 [Daphnia magna]
MVGTEHVMAIVRWLASKLANKASSGLLLLTVTAAYLIFLMNGTNVFYEQRHLQLLETEKEPQSMAMNGEILVYLHWWGTIHIGSGLMNYKNCCYTRRKKKLELVEGLKWNKVLEDKNE